MKTIDYFLSGRKIYCDLDGVLVDLNKSIKTLTGYKDYTEAEAQLGKRELHKLFSNQDSNFWGDMEWLPDSQKLWSIICKYDAQILSSTGGVITAHSGKRLWCRRNLGSKTVVHLVDRSSDKAKMYASDNCILIDDLECNIKEWNDRGSKSIYFKNVDDAIDDLRKIGVF